MSERFVDFDAAWAEVEAEQGDPPTIGVHGEVITLPYALPAALVLYQARNRERLEGERPDPIAVMEMASKLFGQDRVDGWIDDGMAWQKLYGAYLAAVAAMRSRRSGEAQPPATGDSSTTSSPDGPPSKATSPESTDGT